MPGSRRYRLGPPRRLLPPPAIARKGIAQILETAAEYGLEGDEWVNLIRDSRNLTQALRTVERPEELALGVESLERLRIPVIVNGQSVRS